MIINSHCHIFDISCVPAKFKERVGLTLRNPIHKFVHWLLRRFLPSQELPRVEKATSVSPLLQIVHPERHFFRLPGTMANRLSRSASRLRH